VADVADPALDDSDGHHLQRVLRVRPGQAVTVADGAGRWRLCRYTGTSSLSPVGDIVSVERPDPLITIAFALTKGDRPEWTVQKLTEAGVDRMVPMVTARTIVRWDGDRHVARLRAVVRSAAMQSRQVWLPVVGAVQPFSAVAGSGPGACALAHRGAGPPDLARPCVLIGPEGGWADEELACGLPQVSLGPAVLRAETAAMAAGLFLGALRAGLLRPGRS
jgi:16S rRNA (uracil1498-N3)-methyltransferase